MDFVVVPRAKKVNVIAYLALSAVRGTVVAVVGCAAIAATIVASGWLVNPMAVDYFGSLTSSQTNPIGVLMLGGAVAALVSPNIDKALIGHMRGTAILSKLVAARQGIWCGIGGVVLVAPALAVLAFFLIAVREAIRVSRATILEGRPLDLLEVE